MDKLIERWRRSLSGLSTAQIEELEDHLRSEMQTLRSLGLNEREAFTVAAMRCGRSGELVEQYSCESAAIAWRATLHWRNLLTAASGIGAICMIVLAVWSWVAPHATGIFGISDDTCFRVYHGAVVLRHITGVEPAIAASDWPGNPIPQQRITPPQPRFPWMGFSSGHQLGIMQQSGEITPANYWQFYFPAVWVLALTFATVPVMRVRQSRSKLRR